VVSLAGALALEDDLDETLGPALRAAIVTPLFRHDPDIALRVLTTGMGGTARCGRCFGFFHRSTNSATASATTIWRGIGSSSQRRSTASSTSGKTAHILSARLLPSQTSWLPRCWVRSSSLTRFSTH
jgi:hypothetical protein